MNHFLEEKDDDSGVKFGFFVTALFVGTTDSVIVMG
jgi:hypothetical protein